MRRPVVAAAIVVLGVLVFAPGAQACSCAQIAPKEAIRGADAAIIGELVEVVPRNHLRADYRYRVRRVYKHRGGIREGAVISVQSSRSSAACGLPRQAGRRYGLLLTRTRGRWTGGLCGVLRPRQLLAGIARKAGCAS